MCRPLLVLLVLSTLASAAVPASAQVVKRWQAEGQCYEWVIEGDQVVEVRPCEAPAPKPRFVRALFAGIVIAAGSDTASTVSALAGDKRLYEANPLLRPLISRPWALGTARVTGSVALVSYLDRVYARHPRLTTAIAAGILAAHTGVVAWNVRQVHAR